MHLLWLCWEHAAGRSVSRTHLRTPTLQNRLLRLVQRPAGVYHCSVFHQFSGCLGPSGMARDPQGNLYVTRYDFASKDEGVTKQGVISKVSPEGKPAWSEWPPWQQRPSSALAPPRGAPGGSGRLGTPKGEEAAPLLPPPLLPPPLLPPPPPRLLELAASKAADSPAFDRAGKLLEEIVTPAPELTGICISPEQDALFVTEASTNVVYRIPL